MRKSIWSLILVTMTAAIMAQTASAADSNFGLGLVLGDPSGISARIAAGSNNSINVILGYDVNQNDNRYYRDNCCRDGGVLYMGADYVWYNYNLIHVSSGRLPLYFGPGVNFVISNYSSVGIRGVVGLEYQFANAPFDLFFELAPGVNIVPNTEVGVDAGFGGRFFF